MRLMNAKGAASVLMDVYTGEIISHGVFAGFRPERPPATGNQGDPSDSPIFNRAVQGVYELGSAFKIFTAAQAMQLGLVNPETMLDTKGPLIWGRFKIRDFRNYGAQLSVTDVIVKSSNIGTARMAIRLARKRRRPFCQPRAFRATPVELVEAPERNQSCHKNGRKLQR